MHKNLKSENVLLTDLENEAAGLYSTVRLADFSTCVHSCVHLCVCLYGH